MCDGLFFCCPGRALFSRKSGRLPSGGCLRAVGVRLPKARPALVCGRWFPVSRAAVQRVPVRFVYMFCSGGYGDFTGQSSAFPAAVSGGVVRGAKIRVSFVFRTCFLHYFSENFFAKKRSKVFRFGKLLNVKRLFRFVVSAHERGHGQGVTFRAEAADYAPADGRNERAVAKLLAAVHVR